MTLLHIRKAAVIGAGTMGAQIAAHLANVGIRVLLLDIAPRELTPAEADLGLTLAAPSVRNRVVTELFARMRKLSPPPFYVPETAAFITLGNIDDHLADIRDAEWVIEAISEKLELKQSLHARIAGIVRPSALVSTNTSALPIRMVVAGLPEAYRRRFFGTHFFNPPRYMRLLELIPTADTDPTLLRTFATFAEATLGKGVVVAKDTPGFVANRIGCFDLQHVLRLGVSEGLSIDEIDAITGVSMGRPASATFRLCDLVGLDLIAQLGRNLGEMLKRPEEREIFAPPAFLTELVARGWWGEKRKQGFYRRVEVAKRREIQSLDLTTFEYRPVQKPSFAALTSLGKIPSASGRVTALCASDDPAGRFAWKHLSAVLCYAADLIPEIADDPVTVDEAMRWGYNWELGPFELWDALGVAATAERLTGEGRPVPALVTTLLAAGYQSFHEHRDLRTFCFSPVSRDYVETPVAPKAISLPRLHAARRVVTANAGASLLDLGDGVACLEFHAKLNTIGDEQLALLHESLEHVRRGFAGLIIGNQGPHFSAGANLAQFAAHVENGRWIEIERMLVALQQCTSGLRSFELPVVCAVHGYALGGGCEMLMGADHVVAAAETMAGLPEARVGFIPAGHGTKEMLVRCTEGIPRLEDPDYFAGVRLAWETIARAKLSTSAPEGERLRFLRRGEWTLVLNRDWLIGEAKAQVLRLAPVYSPAPPRTDIPAIGQAGLATLKSTLHQMHAAGLITGHDRKVGTKLAHVLCGGDLTSLHYVSEDYLMALEREAFLSLCGEVATLERIRHMLKTGRPLRN